jgi:glycosyltransferase involved in cell wall biosynthesis
VRGLTEDDFEHSDGFLQRTFLHLVAKSGLRAYIHPLYYTKRFRRWVLDFNPDIIYCQSSDITFTTLVLKVYKLTHAPVVIHTMDDWPATVYKKVWFSKILRWIVMRKFTRLLKIASLRLGISQAMATEFEKRYHRPFKYFHNPVTIKDLQPKERQTASRGRYTIVYAGRIGIASRHSIAEFARVVEKLVEKNVDVSFNIYTELENRDMVLSEFACKGTSVLPALKDHDYVEKMAEADLLLYPVDFDSRSIDYIKLSFPTKLPSYLSSGVPVFCYGPGSVHSIEFMKNHGLGFVCTYRQPDELMNALLQALQDEQAQKTYAAKAWQFAKDHFDKELVREQFHGEFMNIVSAHPKPSVPVSRHI